MSKDEDEPANYGCLNCGWAHWMPVDNAHTYSRDAYGQWLAANHPEVHQKWGVLQRQAMNTGDFRASTNVEDGRTTTGSDVLDRARGELLDMTVGNLNKAFGKHDPPPTPGWTDRSPPPYDVVPPVLYKNNEKSGGSGEGW